MVSNFYDNLKQFPKIECKKEVGRKRRMAGAREQSTCPETGTTWKQGCSSGNNWWMGEAPMHQMVDGIEKRISGAVCLRIRANRSINREEEGK